MGRSSYAEVYSRSMNMLAYIGTHPGGKRKGTHTSQKKIMSDLDMTVGKFRASVKLLTACGFLSVKYCYAENGGQLENAFSVTSDGRRALARHTKEQAKEQESRVERVAV